MFEMFDLLINHLLLIIFDAMTFSLLLVFYLSSRVKLSHTKDCPTPSSTLHIREFTVEIFRRNLQWLFAARIYLRNLQ